MDQMKNRIRLLSNVTIFNKLTPEELAALAACCVEREYKKGALILSRNTEGDTLFIVMSGRVKAVLSARSGREIVLSFFKPGEFFGELSLVDKMPRSADVMTIEETKVLTLHRDDFRRLTQQNYELMLSIVAVLCARLRHADELIGNLALMDVYGRIIHHIIELARREGKMVDGWCEIEHAPNQREVANLLGTSRETVSRVFADYKKRGILKSTGGKLLLRASAIAEIDGGQE